jgi:cardiolipin synthase A/B
MPGFLSYPWWVLLLMLAGALAIGGSVVGLFFGLGRRPGRIRLLHEPRIGTDEFLLAAAGVTAHAPRAGGTAQLLNNGTEFYPAIARDIRAARRSVNFMVYIWEAGAASDLMFDALVDRARAGVEVRLLLDAFGALQAPDEWIDRLKEAGGHVEWFRPPALGRMMRIHKRNHRRAIVIDGAVGYTGGAAVADQWLGDARGPDQWRDSMVRVTGPAALTLQSAFTQLWAAVCGDVLAGPAYYPPEADREADTGTWHMGVASSPTADEHPLRLFFILTFCGARERLWITTPYFVPDRHVRNTLRGRAEAGVDVRILLPNEQTDAKPIRWAAHKYYGELLAAGIRIFEYQPTFLHSKTVVADGLWSIVGSANLDVRSKELNRENVLGILDRSLARQLEETFERDLERAREVHMEDWRKRPLHERIAERLSALFEEQY